MKIFLIRHSMTKGNLEKRYIGTTDEPLCEEGARLLKNHCKDNPYPQADKIIVSPMKRCIQSAALIYPERQITVIEELSECDFGMFENKNYEELKGVLEYQKWIDSGGTLSFPRGESRDEFSKRSLKGFEKALSMCKETDKTVSFVVHGGTIMSIMEKYAIPKGSYYDFQIGNGEGYELNLPDDVAGGFRISSGSSSGRSALDVSSGTINRKSDCSGGKNYKKLF